MKINEAVFLIKINKIMETYKIVRRKLLSMYSVGDLLSRPVMVQIVGAKMERIDWLRDQLLALCWEMYRRIAGRG